MLPFFALALYVLLIGSVAGLLRNRQEEVAPVLYWLYGLSSGLAGFPALVYLLNSNWSPSYDAVPILLGLLLSTGLLAGILHRLHLTAFPRLLLGHTLLMGSFCLLVANGYDQDWHRRPIWYQNASFSVIPVGHAYRHEYSLKPAEEAGHTDVNLYETFLGFDHYLGTMMLSPLDPAVARNYLQVPLTDRASWRQVRALTYEASSNLGQIDLPSPASSIKFTLIGPSVPPEGYQEE